jgi:hypothetical protein
MIWTRANVRFWHLADIELSPANVRFRWQSGHHGDLVECSLMTQSEQVADCSTLPRFYSALLFPGEEAKL